MTRDLKLLRRSKQTNEVVGVTVVSPTELLLKLRELSGAFQRTFTRLSGLGLGWRETSASEFQSIDLVPFLNPGEKKSHLRCRLDQHLANPFNRLEFLWSSGRPIAFRILNLNSSTTLRMELARLANEPEGIGFGKNLLSDFVYEIARRKKQLGELTQDSVPAISLRNAANLGFIKRAETLRRFVLFGATDRDSLLSSVAQILPQDAMGLHSLEPLALERICSPASFVDEQNHFLIPIKPQYAFNLFDQLSSANDLFGGDPGILLRWSNVYYRAATHVNSLRPPGRILWYVSRPRSAIVAVSHLDSVEVGDIKDLYRAFSKIGALTWGQLLRVRGGRFQKTIDGPHFLEQLSAAWRNPLKQNSARIERRWGGIDLARSVENPRFNVPQISEHRSSQVKDSVALQPILMSLKPRFFALMGGGIKTAELRRRATHNLGGREVFVYATSPAKELRGGFRIGETWSGALDEIWEQVKDRSGICESEFRSYFRGLDEAFAMEVKDVLDAQYTYWFGRAQVRTRRFRSASILEVRNR